MTTIKWNQLKFGDLLEKKIRVEINKGSEYSFVPMENIDPGHKFPRSIRTKRFAGSGSRFADGDTLFARITPCLENKKVVKVENLRNGVGFGSTELFVFRAKEGIADPDFLFYLSKLDDLRNTAQLSMTGASGRQRADLSVIHDLFVSVPDLPTQSRIASVLSAYDDLIENNEKRIKVLEEMAQRLYTEWFVQFKFPGYEKSRIIDSGTAFGKIPEGWEIIPISKLAGFMNGYPFKPENLGDQGYPIVKIPELRSGILEKTPRNSGDGINKKYFVRTGDILFSWSATLLVNIWNSGDAILNQHLFKVTPKEQIYKAYTFYTLVLLVERIKKHVVGATMQHLRKDTVESAKVLLPSKNVLANYELKASKILEQISLLNRKNQILSKTRDLLIPQLVTGKKELK